MLIIAVLIVVALVVCAVATVQAGQVAPVFLWPWQPDTETVLTRQQYESALMAQHVGRVAAVVALGLCLAAAPLTYLRRKHTRLR